MQHVDLNPMPYEITVLELLEVYVHLLDQFALLLWKIIDLYILDKPTDYYCAYT